MRSLIVLFAAAILVGSCTCDKCPAQFRQGYYVQPQYVQPQYVQPATRYMQPARQYVQPQIVHPQYVQPQRVQPVTPAFNPDRKVTGANSGVYRAGQAIDMPSGIYRLNLTVVVGKNFRSDANQAKVAQWFTGGAPAKDGTFRSANARLRAIQDGVAFHYMYSDDPNFSETERITVMGSESPQIWLTGPDGKIKRDGGAGCFLDSGIISRLSGPDEVADLLIQASDGFNEKPKIQGLIQRPTEVAVPVQIAGSCLNCGTYTGGGPCPNCTPQPAPQPVIQPNATVPARIQPIVPRRSSLSPATAGASALLGLALAGLGYVAYKRPGIKP